MKRISIFFLIIISVILSACSFSKYYYNSGDLETAIGVSASRLRNNPNNWREAVVLEKAYNEAFTKDITRINYLKKEGNPDCWMEIYDHYNSIDKRQKLVQGLLPLFIKKEYRNANITLIDVDAELIESRRKAAEYLYNHAIKLMGMNTKPDFRKAYNEFNEIKPYFSNYKESVSLQQTCYEKGQNHVLVLYANKSALTLPKEFEQGITDINVAQYNTQWVKYAISSDAKTIDDYKIEINIGNITISPEQLRESEYPEEKTIDDGWYYATDSRGNVKKDSLGNDIKLRKIITVRCVIKETVQNKQGSLAGTINFTKNSGGSSNANYQLVKSLPYNETLIFNNIFAVVQGDQRALSEQSRRKLGGKPIPFPSNLQMVMDASNLLRARLGDAIRSNQSVVGN